MTTYDEHGRPEIPLAADEATTLLAFLDHQRATVAWKTAGLGAAGLRATVGPSTMTLAGMLKHLARAEAYWFASWLHEAEAPGPEEAWDADWVLTGDDTPERVRAAWEAAVERSRLLTAEALAAGGLDGLARHAEDGWRPSLRWIVCHMTREYARHAGHADLLREAFDGQVGE